MFDTIMENCDHTLVFAVKDVLDCNRGIIRKSKDRLVALDFQQLKEIHYSVTYSHVVGFKYIRVLMALVARQGVKLH